MVDLTRTFSFKEQVFPHILRERDHYSDGDEGRHADISYEELKDQLQAHIVGQERDGTVLISWVDKSPNGNHKVSYVAAYEPVKSHFKTLFTHDKKVKIVGASVNLEKTLLAFTTIESFISQFDEPPGTVSPGIYKSFLAEIHPQNRIFSLYIERQTFQRVQFLYGTYQCYGSSSKKESHMLFFHHKKAVGLYHIPMARIGDRGMILSSQPRTEQVAGPFLWAQWDTLNERLYCVYKQFKDPSSTDEGEYELMFSAYQFNEKIPHFCVLNIPLPFDLKSCCCEITSSTQQYNNLPLTQTISEKQFNMQVVTMPGGSLFICLQHGLKKKDDIGGDDVSPRVSPLHSQSSHSTVQTVPMEYSVYVLHHGCVLHCVLDCVPECLADSCVLFFSSFYDYLLVLLPGYVMHLLDGSAEHEPCHHIILQDENIPKFSLSDAEGELLVPSLLYFNKQQITSVYPVPNILDYNSVDGFELSFDKQRLVEIFSKTHLSTTRLSLLHLVVVHMKDQSLIKMMVEHLCYDPCSPECSDLLKEYLVGSTYCLLKRALDRERDRDVLRLIPFTCVDTFRGHLEESLDKRRIARLTCTLCRDTTPDPKTFKKKPFDPFWTAVQENRQYIRRPSGRFSSRAVPPVNDDGSDEDNEQSTESSLPPSQPSTMKTLLKKFSMKKYPSNESLASQSSTRSGDFLEPCEDDRKQPEFKKQKLVKEVFATHLLAHLPHETKDKTFNIAAEYVKYQNIQSDALLRLFWSGLGYSIDTNPCTSHLNVQGTAQEIALLQIVERYFTSVTELKFPLPPGFQTFFTTLAFHCLDSRMFLQYLDNQVLQLTGQFISRLIKDCRGECEHAAFVFQILSRLKHDKSKQAMQRWGHPLSQRYLAQQITDELLSHELTGARESLDNLWDGSSRLSDSVSSLDSCDDTSFRPLDTLMSNLKERAALLTAEGKITHGNVFDLRIISDVALRETNKEVDGNLAKVSF